MVTLPELADPMYSPLAMLRRATTIYSGVSAAFDRVLTEGLRGVGVRLDIDAKAIAFIMFDMPGAPSVWDNDVCDTLHNLRASLEHLAKALAVVANAGKPLDSSDSGATTFPLYPSRHQFRSKGGRVERLFRADDWKRIEQVQLYNSTDEAIWAGLAGSGVPHPLPVSLAILDRLAAIGRHQILLPVWMTFDMSSQPKEVHGCHVTGAVQWPEPLVPGAEIGRWFFDEMPSMPPTPDQIMRHLRLQVALHENMYSWADEPDCDFGAVVFHDARQLVESCLTSVRAVMQVFAPSVRNGAPPLTWTSVAHGAPA